MLLVSNLGADQTDLLGSRIITCLDKHPERILSIVSTYADLLDVLTLTRHTESKDIHLRLTSTVSNAAA